MTISDWAVREALGMLREEPPLSLGACTLARELLGSEGDRLERGVQLKVALLSAIDSLQPTGDYDSRDPRWWPWLIYTGVYIEGKGRQDIQSSLSIAPVTYTRHRRKGFDWIAGFLPYLVRMRERAIGE